MTTDTRKPEARRPAARPIGADKARIGAVVSGLLGVLLALAVPFLPVEQTTAELNWPQDGSIGDVSAPVIAQTPIDIELTVPCSAAAKLPAGGGVLLSTVPDGGVDATLRGLFVRADTDSIQVADRNIILVSAPRSAQNDPACAVSVRATTEGVTAEIGTPASKIDTKQVDDANLRPQLTGAYTGLPEGTSTAGFSLHATIDTRYQSTPSLLKQLVIWLGVLTTVAALVALHVLDRRDGRANRRVLPANWWRFTWVDTGVTLVLAYWWLGGANTSDDGYQLTVSRVAPDAGYNVNYYRYFGGTQDPFGWHYFILRWFAEVNTATPWMRVPALLLGLLGWWLLSREIIPRLGRTVRLSAPALWAGAAVYLAFWLPYNNGLRVEPAIAIGLLLTWCSLERAIATGRLLPLAVALIAGAFTVDIAPSGLIVFAVLASGAPPILRRLVARHRRDGLLPTLAPLAAAGLAVMYAIFADQTLAGSITAAQVNTEVGPTLKWYEEPQRLYWTLLSNIDGSMPRRFPVFLGLLCLAILVVVMLRKRTPLGIARGAVWRLVGIYVGTFVIMAFTPTKWSHQQGVYAGIGAAVAAVTAALVAPAMLRGRRNRAFVYAAVFLLGGLAFAGWNGWWFVGNYGLPWNDRPPKLGPLTFSWAFVGLALIAFALAMYFHYRDPYVADDVRTGKSTRRLTRLLPPPIPAIAVLVVLFEVLTFVKGSWAQRDSYSWTSANVNALLGRPCSHADVVLVEEKPNEAILRPLAGGISPGDALSGGPLAGAPGFSPDGVASDLSVEEDKDTEDAATTPGAVDAADPNAPQDPTSDTPEGPGNAARGVNGSTVPLPFGLSPATTPVLGTYGKPGIGALTSSWYRLPEPDASRPLLVVAVAGSVYGIDGAGIAHDGQSLVVEWGRAGAGGQVTPLGTSTPLDAGQAPEWRNLRFPLQNAPADADVARLVAKDVSPADDQWLAVTPPRVPTMRTLQEVVGSVDPVFIDWVMPLAFPCQQPMKVRNGVFEIPKWRILPDAGAVKQNSLTWMSGDAGGPLRRTSGEPLGVWCPGAYAAAADESTLRRPPHAGQRHLSALACRLRRRHPR